MIVLLFVIALPPAQQLQKAEEAYDSYEYAKAIPMLEQLLRDNPQPAVRQRARLILAFAHYLNKSETRAKDTLRELFNENPNYVLDRDATHPDLVKFYDTERKAWTPPVAKPKVEQKIAPPPAQPAAETIGDRNPWLRIFPLGIGQFVNHDYLAGSLFLSIEVALVGLNVGGALWRQSMRAPGTPDFREGTTPVTAQILQNAGAIGAIVVGIIGIVDAFVWSPARGRATLRTVDLGPLGDYAWSLGWTTSSSN